MEEQRLSRICNHRMFTLKISGEFAHEEAVEPDDRDLLAHSHGHADQSDEKVRHGQVDQKVIGYTVNRKKKKRRPSSKALFAISFIFKGRPRSTHISHITHQILQFTLGHDSHQSVGKLPNSFSTQEAHAFLIYINVCVYGISIPPHGQLRCWSAAADLSDQQASGAEDTTGNFPVAPFLVGSASCSNDCVSPAGVEKCVQLRIQMDREPIYVRLPGGYRESFCTVTPAVLQSRIFLLCSKKVPLILRLTLIELSGQQQRRAPGLQNICLSSPDGDARFIDRFFSSSFYIFAMKYYCVQHHIYPAISRIKIYSCVVLRTKTTSSRV